MAVVALGCWWVHKSERQRFHFNKLQTEADLTIGCQLQDMPAWLGWLPDSVQAFRGGHYFRGVKRIYIGGIRPADREADLIAWRKVLPLLPSCKVLSFSEVTLRDFHFANLAKAKSLEHIEFSQICIDPETNARFPSFVHLKNLFIISEDIQLSLIHI